MAQVPTTDAIYTGDGSTTQYAITFEYLEPEDVKVTIDEVNVSFTFAAPGIVNVIPAPANGAAIRVYRDTPAIEVAYVFSEGKPFLLKYADTNWKKLLFAFQEAWAEFTNNARNYIKTLRTPEDINQLPPADERAGKVVSFDANGQPIMLDFAPESVPGLDYRVSAIESFLVNIYNIFPRKIDTWASMASVSVIGAGQLFDLAQHTSGGLGGGRFMAFAGSVTEVEGFQRNTATPGYYLKRINYSYVTPEMCGALGNGANDTAAVQKAIDFCNIRSVDPGFNTIPCKKLGLMQMYRINSTLYIDRKVDTNLDLFIIEGITENAGFTQTTGFVMFSSRLPYGPSGGSYTKSPVTDFTEFYNVTFINSINSSSGFVFDEKYLRLSFRKCRFRGIRGALGTDFFQSIKFHGCHFRGSNGYFLQNKDGYDIRIIDACEFESAGQGFNFTGTLFGSSLESALCQNSTMPLINCFKGLGVSVDRVYFEANTGSSSYIIFGSGMSDGVNVTGCFFGGAALETDPNFYPVDFGNTKHGNLVGCFSGGNLADNSLTAPFAIFQHGNAVPTNRSVVKVSTVSRTIAANVAGTQAAATPITSEFSDVTSAALNGSVLLPSLLTMQERSVLTVFNQSGAAIQVFPATSERILGLAYNAATTIAAGGSARFGTSKSDYWVQL